ncbi:MAG: hypothetical protein H6704_16305 [Myxococcales bacterium]|nr:hypothetical protein [Myxococcales bacterium]MCB9537815.1 hypothetical protein [Myxococcales bacterium]
MRAPRAAAWLIAALTLATLSPAAAVRPPDASEVASDPVIEDVRLEGVRLGRREVLAQRLDLRGPLDEAQVEDARLRLLATGLFEQVQARLEKGSARGRVVVVFDCVERTTTSLDAFHLGVARPSGPWLGAEISDLDPLGLGVTGELGLVSSGEQTAVQMGLGVRDALGLGAALKLRLRFIDGEEPMVGPRGQQIDGAPVDQVFLPYTRAGGELAGTYGLLDALSLHASLQAEWVDAEVPGGATQLDPDGAVRPFRFHVEDGAWLLGVVALGLQYDTRDDPAFPARGLRASVVTRVGVSPDAFVSGLAGFEHYVALPFGHVLRWDAKAGAVLGDAPFFERFFIGDLHPYIPPRALGLNFARRRGPNLVDGTIVEQRYERLAGRVGAEYRIPLGGGPRTETYGVEFFVGGALLSLGSPGALREVDFVDRRPFPLDVAIDFGLRAETEIGVMGLSVGNLLLLVDP